MFTRLRNFSAGCLLILASTHTGLALGEERGPCNLLLTRPGHFSSQEDIHELPGAIYDEITSAGFSSLQAVEAKASDVERLMLAGGDAEYYLSDTLDITQSNRHVTLDETTDLYEVPVGPSKVTVLTQERGRFLCMHLAVIIQDRQGQIVSLIRVDSSIDHPSLGCPSESLNLFNNSDSVWLVYPARSVITGSPPASITKFVSIAGITSKEGAEATWSNWCSLAYQTDLQFSAQWSSDPGEQPWSTDVSHSKALEDLKSVLRRSNRVAQDVLQKVARSANYEDPMISFSDRDDGRQGLKTKPSSPSSVDSIESQISSPTNDDLRTAKQFALPALLEVVPANSKYSIVAIETADGRLTCAASIQQSSPGLSIEMICAESHFGSKPSLARLRIKAFGGDTHYPPDVVADK